MFNITFRANERKHVKIEIHSTDNAQFDIAIARYELQRYNVVESEGSCAIYEHTIDALISPQQSGKYNLKIIYEIADERLIEDITIEVS